MPRFGWLVDGFTEEHPVESVLLGSVGLDVSMPGVVGGPVSVGLDAAAAGSGDA